VFCVGARPCHGVVAIAIVSRGWLDVYSTMLCMPVLVDMASHTVRSHTYKAQQKVPAGTVGCMLWIASRKMLLAVGEGGRNKNASSYRPCSYKACKRLLKHLWILHKPTLLYACLKKHTILCGIDTLVTGLC